MRELRWNPLLEVCVTVAPWRQDRTYHPPADHCPLDPTRPGMPETEAGSELGAGAFILDARAEDTAAELRDA